MKYRIKFRSKFGAVTEATSDDYDKIKSVWDRALLIPGNDDLLGGVETSKDDGVTWEPMPVPGVLSVVH